MRADSEQPVAYANGDNWSADLRVLVLVYDLRAAGWQSDRYRDSLWAACGHSLLHGVSESVGLRDIRLLRWGLLSGLQRRMEQLQRMELQRQRLEVGLQVSELTAQVTEWEGL